VGGSAFLNQNQMLFNVLTTNIHTVTPGFIISVERRIKFSPADVLIATDAWCTAEYADASVMGAAARETIAPP